MVSQAIAIKKGIFTFDNNIAGAIDTVNITQQGSLVTVQLYFVLSARPTVSTEVLIGSFTGVDSPKYHVRGTIEAQQRLYDIPLVVGYFIASTSKNITIVLPDDTPTNATAYRLNFTYSTV